MPRKDFDTMKSEDLAFEVESFIYETKDRVLGIGDEQYSRGDDQKFEVMAFDDLFEYLEEEIRDVAAYATMLHIRIERMKKAIPSSCYSALETWGDGHRNQCSVYEIGVCTCQWKPRDV